MAFLFFTSLPFSLPSLVYLSPFPPETPDTQATWAATSTTSFPGSSRPCWALQGQAEEDPGDEVATSTDNLEKGLGTSQYTDLTNTMRETEQFQNTKQLDSVRQKQINNIYPLQ